MDAMAKKEFENGLELMKNLFQHFEVIKLNKCLVIAEFSENLMETADGGLFWWNLDTSSAW